MIFVCWCFCLQFRDKLSNQQVFLFDVSLCDQLQVFSSRHKLSNPFFCLFLVCDSARLTWVGEDFFFVFFCNYHKPLSLFLSLSLFFQHTSLPLSIFLPPPLHSFIFPVRWMKRGRGVRLLIVLCSRVKRSGCTSSHRGRSSLSIIHSFFFLIARWRSLHHFLSLPASLHLYLRTRILSISSSDSSPSAPSSPLIAPLVAECLVLLTQPPPSPSTRLPAGFQFLPSLTSSSLIFFCSSLPLIPLCLLSSSSSRVFPYSLLSSFLLSFPPII